MDERILRLCKRLIATRSVTGEGTRAIAELCTAEILAPAGIEARLIPSANEGDAQVNLLAIVRGRNSAATPLVLNTHLDTVPPGDPALWTECGSDPFAPTIASDRIYGLGAADTKLDFVAKASALAQTGTPRRDVYLVATFGEEHGLRGAKEIAAAGLLPAGALAFVGEPSHLAVVTAHKGFIVSELMLRPTANSSEETVRANGATRIVFAGKAAHSSTPHLGRNAIAAALDFIAADPRLEVLAIAGGDAVNKVPARCELTIAGKPSSLPAEAASEQVALANVLPVSLSVLRAAAKFSDAVQNFADHSGSEPDYPAPSLTSNLGVIRSEAGTIRIEFEMRPPPAMPLDSVRQGLQSIVEILGRRFSGIEAELRELRANPGFRSPEGSEPVEISAAAMARAGIEIKTAVKLGCTEAGIYAAAGLKPVVFGPGPSAGVIHAPNEYNLLSEVEAAIRFYRSLLEL